MIAYNKEDEDDGCTHYTHSAKFLAILGTLPLATLPPVAAGAFSPPLNK